MWAQSTSDQNAGGAPPAATGLDTTTQMSENPPLSGLDQPSFEPGFGTRSYLAPKVELSEALDSNGLGNFSNSNTTESTRALGSLDLQKLWKLHPLDRGLCRRSGLVQRRRRRRLPGSFARSDAALSVAHRSTCSARLLQLSARRVIWIWFLWRRGSFRRRRIGRTGFSGSLGAGIFSNSTYGAIGTQVTNMAIADVTQYLSPRSSVVLTGGYGLTDFLSTPTDFLLPYKRELLLQQPGGDRPAGV